MGYVLVLAVVALEVPLASSVADRIDAEVKSQARGQADVVAASLSDLLGPGDRRDRDRLVDVAATNVRGRVIVVDPQGDLIADSEGTPPGRSYAGRPEIGVALSGRPDQRERRSETLNENLLLTSIPIIVEGRTAGAVRVSQAVDAVDRAVWRSVAGLILIGLLVIGLGLLAGSVVAGQIARPMGRLDSAARRVAEGDLTTRAEVEGSAEQQSLAATFNEMTARLERLVSSQRDFVADASHQLRTPVTGLRLRVEAARADTRDPEVAEELDAALAELDRLTHIIEELLQLSQAGERSAGGERLSLGELGERAADRWEALAAEKEQRLAERLGADGAAWLSRADADRILDALVENAIKYSPPGTEIEIAALAGGVEVRDRGPGIAPGEEEQVFERFHRGGAGRGGGAPGTGLGLTIARELARTWGGDVTLRRRDGGGTVAVLTLPPA
ncbi:MAG: ATP-binding protein [Solirubrobacteraceae bacterium]